MRKKKAEDRAPPSSYSKVLLTASALPPAPIHRDDGPSDAAPKQHEDAVDGRNARAPKHNGRHPTGDSLRPIQIPRPVAGLDARLWGPVDRHAHTPAQTKPQEAE